MTTTQPKPSPLSLADVVRQQDARIEQLMAVLERQSRMIEAMLARGGPAVPEPIAAPAPAHGPTFAELWKRYMESLGPKDWIPQITSLMRWPLAWFAPSVCSIRQPGRRGKSPIHGPDMLAADIKATHWTDFRNDLIRRQPQIGVGSRRLMQKRFSAALNWATNHEVIEKNRIATVLLEPPRPKRETRVTIDYLQRLRPHASDIGWAYAVTLRHSIMRPGEVRLLLWSQVDKARPEDNYEIELSWTVTKGKRKSRPAYLTAECIDAYKALPRLADNPYVFGSPRRKGRPYSKTRLWRFFRDAADAAGLEPAPGDNSVRPHDSRRGGISELISLDVSLAKVQSLAGHSSITTTMGYVNVDRKDLREAHGRLAGSARKPPRRSGDLPDGVDTDTQK